MANDIKMNSNDAITQYIGYSTEETVTATQWRTQDFSMGRGAEGGEVSHPTPLGDGSRPVVFLVENTVCCRILCDQNTNEKFATSMGGGVLTLLTPPSVHQCFHRTLGLCQRMAGYGFTAFKHANSGFITSEIVHKNTAPMSFQNVQLIIQSHRQLTVYRSHSAYIQSKTDQDNIYKKLPSIEIYTRWKSTYLCNHIELTEWMKTQISQPPHMMIASGETWLRKQNSYSQTFTVKTNGNTTKFGRKRKEKKYMYSSSLHVRQHYSS